MILPEYKQGLSIMSLLYNSEQKKLKHNKFINFMIAFVKIMSGIICECVHILIIASQDETADIIKDFVAVGFIVEIDNWFAKYYRRRDDLDSLISEMQKNLKIERATDTHRKRLESLGGESVV